MGSFSCARAIFSYAPRVIKVELLPAKTPVYYFVKETKQGKSKKGFVDEAKDHIVTVTTNPRGSRHNLRIDTKRFVWSSHRHYSTILKGLELELSTDSSKTSDIDSMAMDSSSGLEASRSEETQKGTPSVESALWFVSSTFKVSLV